MEGCNEPFTPGVSGAGGMCRRHYQAAREHRPLLPERQRAPAGEPEKTEQVVLYLTAQQKRALEKAAHGRKLSPFVVSLALEAVGHG